MPASRTNLARAPETEKFCGSKMSWERVIRELAPYRAPGRPSSCILECDTRNVT